MSPANASLLEGDVLQFEARVEDETGRALNRATVTWMADPADGLLIDSMGVGEAMAAGTVEVTATFRGVTGTANVTILPAPRIAVDPASVEFQGAVGGASPDPISVEVGNGGNGSLGGLSATVTYPTGGPSGWLAADLAEADAPTDLVLTPTTDGLSVGRYTATVSITSPDDDESPLDVPVTLSLAGITVSESDDSTRVEEAAGTDSLSVVLDAQPDSTVVLTVTSSDPGEVTAAPSTLTFTATDWDSPQIVVLTGQDEQLSDGDQRSEVTIAVDTAASDPIYDPIPPLVVSVTTGDDDDAAFVVTQSAGATTVDESGTSDSLSVVLAAEPLTPVVLDVSALDQGEAVASPTRLTFTPADWNAPQTITVMGVDDRLLDGDVTSTVVIGVSPVDSDDAFDPVPPDSIDVTTTDDDLAGFTLTETPPTGPGEDTTSVGEDGSTDEVAIVLGSQPVDDVVFAVSSADEGEVTVAPASVTFTSASWDTPVTITLTGVDDDVLDRDQTTPVTFTVDAANSDDDFDGLAPRSIDVTTVDDDAALFTVTESEGGSSVTEAGGTDDFTVVLGAQPASDVVFDVASANTLEVTISTASLTFTSANWNVPQSVTMTGVDELVDDGDRQTVISVVIDPALSDDDFDTLAPDSVVVTTVNDDTAGFVLAETAGGTLVSETGTTDSLTLVLTSEPVSDVVLTITSQNSNEATVDPTSLTFTPTDWNVVQSVEVRGVDDLDNDDDQFTLIGVAVSAGLSDPAFADVVDQTVSVTTIDNDSDAGFTVTATGGTTVREGGQTDDFTVTLDTQPGVDVRLSVTVEDPTEVIATPDTLIFTGANWNVAQTVSVSAVDDEIIDGTQVSNVTVSVDVAGSDPIFELVPDSVIPVTTLDNDTPGIVLADTASTTVTEAGGTDDFTVMLAAEPNSAVVLDVTSSDPGEVVSDSATLTFTPANWNAPQPVPVRGVNDESIDGPQSSTITLAVDDGLSDPDFSGLSVGVAVTTVDDDAGALAVADTAGLTVTEAGGSAQFTVTLGAQPASSVVLDISVSDPGEVTADSTSITFTPGNWNVAKAVVLRGVDDAFVDGTVASTVGLAVNDGASDPDFAGLTLVVGVATTDDDIAGFTLADTAALAVDEAGSTDVFTVVLDRRPLTNVVMTVSSADGGEVTPDSTTVTFTPADWDLPRPVPIRGVDDFILDGPQATTVTIAVNNPLSDDAFDGLASAVSVTTADDDVAGFTLADTSGTVVGEVGGSAPFTVVLDARPAADVVLTVSSDDPSESVADPVTITFTPPTWNTARQVVVRGVDDDLIDGTQASVMTVAVDDGASDPDFVGLSSSFSVSTTDDDIAGLTVTEIGGTTVNESGGSTDDFTVVLDAQPATDVVVSITSLDTGEATVSVDSLTFTPATWDSVRTVTVTGVVDNEDDGDQTTDVPIEVDPARSDADFDGLADTVQVVTRDVDGVGFLISDGGSTVVSESGSSDGFTVRLTTVPAGDVVLSVVSGDPGEASVAPDSLTFTSGNWADNQTVTVTGVDDDQIDGSVVSVITLAIDPARTQDAGYDTLQAQTVNATTIDDDAPSLVLSDTAAVTVSEAGSSDQFLVALGAQPASDVVLLISSGTPGEVTPDASSVTFTNGDWNTPQVVSVTGVDDDVIDGNVTSLITLAVDNGASDAAFAGLSVSTTVTTTDDDAAGLLLGDTVGLTVDESGTTDAFTVELNSQPASNVVIDLSSSDTGEATVNPSQLTFTPINWSTPRSVTLTGIDDPTVDGPRLSSIILQVNAGLSDPEFAGLGGSASVTTTDDDVPGLTLADTVGLTVGETTGTDAFTVVLDRQPLADVVLNIVTDDATELASDSTSVTFSSLDWDTPRSIPLRGVDDSILDGPQVTTVTVSVNDPLSDNAFDGLSVATVVTTVDDDAAGLTLTDTANVVVGEDGTTDQFNVRLDAQPSSNVVLSIASADPTEVVPDSTSITFTPANWNVTQPVQLRGVDDDVIDGPVSSTIQIEVVDASSDDQFDELSAAMTVTTNDDDAGGFTLADTTNTTVTEAGSTNDFTVVLDAQPTSNVVFTITSSDPGEATVDSASLTFTPANWNVAQPVPVRGVDDAVIDGSQLSLIGISVDNANSDDDFDGLSASVSVTTIDDDAPALFLADTASLTVGEDASTDQFTVRLAAQPSSNVEVDITSGDPGEVTPLTTTLTFTTSTWNIAQLVPLQGVDDPIIDGSQTTAVLVAVDDANSDDDFDGLTASVDVTTLDDEAAGIVVADTANTTVSESGTIDPFTVVLGAQPASTVVLNVSSSVPSETTSDSTTLTFTPANWNVAQPVPVEGVDDDVIDGPQSSIITVSVDGPSSDPDFAGLSVTVAAITTDDDIAGLSLADTTGLEVDEAGGSAQFTVALAAEPASPVVVDITPNDPSEVVYASPSLTFTPANWSVAQPVSLSAFDDETVDGSVASTVAVEVNGGLSDPAFAGLAASVRVTTTDDDIAGFTLADTVGLSVDESGTTDSFTAVLDRQPLTNVVFTISNPDPGEVQSDSTSLTFTPTNWNVVQTIPLLGVDDFVIDGVQQTTLTISVNNALSDDAFDGQSGTVTVATVDDDVAGVTLADFSGTSVTEDGGIDPFTVVLDARPASNVVVNVSTDDATETSLFPTPLTFTPANWNTAQQVTVRGVDDALVDGPQASVITVAVDDALSDDAFDGFSSTFGAVTSDDDVAAMTVAEIGGTTVNEAGSSTDDFTVVLDAEPASDVVFSVTSPDLTEVTVSVDSLIFTPATWDSARTVTVTGVNDDNDDGDQLTRVPVVVDPARSDPAFGALADTVDVTTRDDDGVGIVLIEVGSTIVDEGGGTDQFAVRLASEPTGDVVLAVVSADPGEASIDLDSLTFTAADWSLDQPVTVTGEDDLLVDGSIMFPVRITVDAARTLDPAYDTLAVDSVNVTNNDDEVANFTVEHTNGSTVAAEGGAPDSITVVLDAQPLDDVVLDIVTDLPTDGTVTPTSLTFTTANWNVAQPVTFTATDDPTVDGDRSHTFTVSIDPAGSQDAWDGVGDQTLGATTTDDDPPTYTLEHNDGSTNATEGAADSITVVLDAQPLGNVVLDLVTDDAGDATVSPAALTFGNVDWDQPQTVIFTAVDDLTVDGTGTRTITATVDQAATDDAWDASGPEVLSATTTDDDVAAFTVTETNGATNAVEGGATDSITVVLDAQPIGDVVLNVSVDDTGDATVTPTTLTFTNADWDQEQTVVFSAVDDPTIDGAGFRTITVEIDQAGSDDAWDGVAQQTVAATTTDDESPTYTIDHDDGSTSAAEGGAPDNITVVLDVQPIDPVIFQISVDDEADATVTPATLTFTSANWNVEQSVAFGADDDVLADGTRDRVITVAVDPSSDDAWDAVGPQTLAATTTDDEVAAFTIDHTNLSTSATEGGVSDSVTAVLDFEPIGDVVIDFTVDDLGDATVAPTSLTFTSANWSTPQFVAFSAVDDPRVDGNGTRTVTASVDPSLSQDAWDGAVDQDLQATTVDTDVAGVTVTPNNGLTTTEAGGSDTFTLVLDTEPTADVTIAVVSNDSDEGTASPASVTFTPANWDTPQTVTVTGVDDDLDDGFASYVIFTGNATSADGDYDGINPDDVGVTNADDDDSGFTVTPTTGLTTTEGGGTAQFTVVLDAEPTATVTIGLSSSDTSEGNVGPVALLFTAGDWDTPQTVTVTGENDPFADGDVSYTAVTATATSADLNYDGLDPDDVSVTNLDDEAAPGFDVSERGGDTVTNEDGLEQNLDVVLTARPETDVVLTIDNPDTGEITLDATTLTFTTDNWDQVQTIVVTGVNDSPDDDGDQITTITVAVDAALSADPFDGLAPQTIDATTVDLDPREDG